MSHVVVTGSNRGIGLALCQLFHARGDEVTATCRVSSPGLDALGVDVFTGMDVTDEAAIARLADHVRDRPIDRLVLSAGIMRRQTLGSLDAEGIREQFEVNALGPLRMSGALAPGMAPGSSIAIITSRMGSIADNTSGGSYGYRMSKAAVNMAGKSLSHDLKDQGIAVAILHPGWVQTDMTGHSGHVDAETAARGLINRMDELTLETTGSFWHAQGDLLPW